MTTDGKRHPRILLSSDKGGSLGPIATLLQTGNYELTLVASAADAAAAIRRLEYELTIIACSQIRAHPELAELLTKSTPSTAVLVLLESADDGQDVGLTPGPEVDLIEADATPARLQAAVDRLLQLTRLKRQTGWLSQQAAMSYGFDNLIGENRVITQVRESVRRVAETDLAVVLQGPPGSGKDLVAGIIHHHSQRRRGPFIKIDFADITEPLLETTLLGQPGQTAPGLLRQAVGGTMYWDHLDEAPLSIHELLLQVVRQGTVPLPGLAAVEKTDARLLVSTTQPVEAIVSGASDERRLWQQLSAVHITLPALAEHPEDIELLIGYFLRRLAKQMRRPEPIVSRAALEYLSGQPWPGNAAELKTTLQQVLAISGNDHLDVADFYQVLDRAYRTAPAIRADTAAASSGNLLNDGQRAIIIKALNDNDWNFTQTAQELGIGRTTLWRKVKKYGLERDKTLVTTG